MTRLRHEPASDSRGHCPQGSVHTSLLGLGSRLNGMRKVQAQQSQRRALCIRDHAMEATLVNFVGRVRLFRGAPSELCSLVPRAATNVCGPMSPECNDLANSDFGRRRCGLLRSTSMGEPTRKRCGKWWSYIGDADRPSVQSCAGAASARRVIEHLTRYHVHRAFLCFTNDALSRTTSATAHGLLLRRRSPHVPCTSDS
jgi:hypothetical protein